MRGIVGSPGRGVSGGAIRIVGSSSRCEVFSSVKVLYCGSFSGKKCFLVSKKRYEDLSRGALGLKKSMFIGAFRIFMASCGYVVRNENYEDHEKVREGETDDVTFTNFLVIRGWYGKLSWRKETVEQRSRRENCRGGRKLFWGSMKLKKNGFGPAAPVGDE